MKTNTPIDCTTCGQPARRLSRRQYFCKECQVVFVPDAVRIGAPQRFDRIILANTACHYPDPTNWRATAWEIHPITKITVIR